MSIEKISTAGWEREKWQRWRRTVKTIGGSDAGVVLGMNPYKSAYTLWAEKTGALEPEDISKKEAVRLGNDLEDYVAKRWKEKTGKRVCRCNAILTNTEYPFAHANIDRSVIGEPNAGLECKTTSSFDITRKLKDGEVPDSWYCQCMHYMMVTGAKRWYLAALSFGAGFFEFTIERDEEDIQELARSEARFYERVLCNIAPLTDGSVSTQESMSRLMNRSNEKTIDASGVMAYLMVYKSARKRIQELENQLRDAEAHIKLYMGDADKATCTGFSVTWKTQERSTFDRSRWERDHGEIPEGYFRKTTARPFKVTMKEN